MYVLQIINVTILKGMKRIKNSMTNLSKDYVLIYGKAKDKNIAPTYCNLASEFVFHKVCVGSSDISLCVSGIEQIGKYSVDYESQVNHFL